MKFAIGFVIGALVVWIPYEWMLRKMKKLIIEFMQMPKIPKKELIKAKIIKSMEETK